MGGCSSQASVQASVESTRTRTKAKVADAQAAAIFFLTHDPWERRHIRALAELAKPVRVEFSALCGVSHVPDFCTEMRTSMREVRAYAAKNIAAASDAPPDSHIKFILGTDVLEDDDQRFIKTPKIPGLPVEDGVLKLTYIIEQPPPKKRLVAVHAQGSTCAICSLAFEWADGSITGQVGYPVVEDHSVINDLRLKDKLTGKCLEKTRIERLGDYIVRVEGYNCVRHSGDLCYKATIHTLMGQAITCHEHNPSHDYFGQGHPFHLTVYKDLFWGIDFDGGRCLGVQTSEADAWRDEMHKHLHFRY